MGLVTFQYKGFEFESEFIMEGAEQYPSWVTTTLSTPATIPSKSVTSIDITKIKKNPPCLVPEKITGKTEKGKEKKKK